MRNRALALIEAPLASCRLTVAIPARNEERLLRRTLEAFAEQTSLDGRALESGLFDIIVFANNCSDGTAGVARAFAASHPAIPTAVVCGRLPKASANVGMARKLVMDLAALRFSSNGRPRGIVATTDADTLVSQDWVAHVLAESGVDAVAGHVTIADGDLATMLAPVRVLYSRERAYRRALAAVSDALDPLPYDPWPRHASFVGASFAVAADTYLKAGGVPPLAVLEDRTFSEQLHRIDARVRHSLAVTAQTSGRRIGRVRGGFGTFVDDLYRHGAAGESYLVEHPNATIDEFALRGSLRRIWNHEFVAADFEHVSTIVGGATHRWLPLLDRRRPFGEAYDRLRGRVLSRDYEPVPIERAIDVLRAATAALKAPSATRIAAASGAG